MKKKYFACLILSIVFSSCKKRREQKTVVNPAEVETNKNSFKIT
jgi:nitrous oxide reductase accessory protein NosL